MPAEKSYNVEDIRKEHENAYAPWSIEDDEQLQSDFSKDKSVSELAKIFGRNKGAIRSRLKKLGYGI